MTAWQWECALAGSSLVLSRLPGGWSRGAFSLPSSSMFIAMHYSTTGCIPWRKWYNTTQLPNWQKPVWPQEAEGQNQGIADKSVRVAVRRWLCFCGGLPTRWPRGKATGRGAGRSGFESRVEVMLAKNHSSWCEGKLPTLPLITVPREKVYIYIFYIHVYLFIYIFTSVSRSK